jgi:dihydroorotase
MSLVIKNAEVFYEYKLQKLDLLIEQGLIKAININIPIDNHKTIDAKGLIILPGLVDIHTHLREPGFEDKETIKTGTLAAAHGGFTTICCMPNLNPVIDNLIQIEHLINIIKHDALIRVLPYASLTIDQAGTTLVDINHLAKYCFAFSDDGYGLNSTELLLEAMILARTVNKCIIVHAEDTTLSNNGVIHHNDFATKHNLPTISSASEFLQVERDLKLVAQTHCQYHVCHVSTKETVELIRQAKKNNLNVSCEVTVHHLLLDDACLKDDGIYKMNPPLRDKADRKALINGVIDGTIDLIVTDHAPHTQEEKAKGLLHSSFGVVGLDFAFGLIYTNLVKTKIISLTELVALMSSNSRKLFNLKVGKIEIGGIADLAIFDLNETFTIDEKFILSKAKATPFLGYKCYGKTIYTIVNGKIIYRDRHD